MWFFLQQEFNVLELLHQTSILQAKLRLILFVILFLFSDFSITSLSFSYMVFIFNILAYIFAMLGVWCFILFKLHLPLHVTCKRISHISVCTLVMHVHHYLYKMIFRCKPFDLIILWQACLVPSVQVQLFGKYIDSICIELYSWISSQWYLVSFAFVLFLVSLNLEKKINISAK